MRWKRNSVASLALPCGVLYHRTLDGLDRITRVKSKQNHACTRTEPGSTFARSLFLRRVRPELRLPEKVTPCLVRNTSKDSIRSVHYDFGPADRAWCPLFGIDRGRSCQDMHSSYRWSPTRPLIALWLSCYIVSCWRIPTDISRRHKAPSFINDR